MRLSVIQAAQAAGGACRKWRNRRRGGPLTAGWRSLKLAAAGCVASGQASVGVTAVKSSAS